MVVWSLGSVQEEVGKIVLDIPTALSGAVIQDIANQQMLFMENFTGQSIGSVNISSRFHQPLLHLTSAAVLSSMELEDSAGGDIDSFKIGDISVKRGAGVESVTTKARNQFYSLGMNGLRLLGKDITFHKANG